MTPAIFDPVGAPMVLAHLGHDASGVWSGLAHPITGLDHALAMLTVGALAILLRSPLVMPGVFLGAMILGGALGVEGLWLPGGEMLIAGSVLVLGAALFAGARAQVPTAVVLVAFVGVAHGLAHGAEAPRATAPILYFLGFIVTTALIHIVGAVAGHALVNRPAWRAVSGSAVMFAGGGLLLGAL